MRARVLLLAPLVVLLAGALCQPLPEPVPDNEPPTVRLVWPQLWPRDDPAPFDATETSDSEDLIRSFAFIFGDGEESQSNDTGLFDHLYTSAGNFSFVLTVHDDRGAQSVLEGEIVIVDDRDDPPCTCAVPCFSPATCTPDGCFLSAVAQEGVDAGTLDAPVVDDPIVCE